MQKRLDILGLGAVAVDDLLYVRSYPPANSKQDVTHRERQCGGLTATALVAASRLGARCAYAGVLGTDELSKFAIQTMKTEGIFLDYLILQEGKYPFYSTIIVGQEGNTRNIFVSRENVVGADPEQPSEEVIQSCKVFFADHIGMEGMLRAMRIARKAGIPVVSDLERIVPRLDEFWALIDHPIIPMELAQKIGKTDILEDIFNTLWDDKKSVVVITGGEEGCWYRTAENAKTIFHQPAYRVNVVDTTGCGDVFHGAYAAGLAMDLPVDKRIQFATAAAALKATHRGGQAGAPTFQEVSGFLSSQDLSVITQK